MVIWWAVTIWRNCGATEQLELEDDFVDYFTSSISLVGMLRDSKAGSCWDS